MIFPSFDLEVVFSGRSGVSGKCSGLAGELEIGDLRPCPRGGSL